VGAAYGLVHRALGAVSLVGPVRMDYEKALAAVRSAASELSRFSESVYSDR
jgi:heat-inducible transcriptional repressor